MSISDKVAVVCGSTSGIGKATAILLAQRGCKLILLSRNEDKLKKTIDELTKIYKKLYFQNNTFVHRDFHASNIMVNKNKLGLIDSQDAIIGNPLYDVASLIDDVRIKLPSNLQERLLNFYYYKSKLKKDKSKKVIVNNIITCVALSESLKVSISNSIMIFLNSFL